MDPMSLVAGNLLLDNDEGAAAVEMQVVRVTLVLDPAAVREAVAVLAAEPGLAAADGLLRIHANVLQGGLTRRMLSLHTDK